MSEGAALALGFAIAILACIGAVRCVVVAWQGSKRTLARVGRKLATLDKRSDVAVLRREAGA